jgi:hypothetical protein
MSRIPSTDPVRELERRARRRVKMKLGWMVHAIVFVAVNLGLYVLNHVIGGRPWHVYPLAGWALGLAIHGGVVALVLVTGDWRGRMVAREMARLQR